MRLFTPIDRKILIFLEQNSDKRNYNIQMKMAYSLDVTYSHITSRVSLLSERGLIYDKNGHDKRKRHWYLTAKGREVVVSLYKVQAILTKLKGGIKAKWITKKN